MSKHIHRMSHIGRYALPPKGTFARQSFEKWFDSLPPNVKLNKNIRKSFKKAHAIVCAQLENGCGFPVDEITRFFLLEYNDRNWRHGLRSMPSSFNVMEAFFEYIPEYSMFRLREERGHLFSFVEFLDYSTSSDVVDDIREALKYIEEGIIYSYNVDNDPGEITFSIDNGTEFGVGGASLVRYGSEVNILLLAGEKADLATESKEIQKKNWDMDELTVAPGKESLRPADDRKREAVPLLGNNQFWQSIVLTRVDFEDMTQNVRYVMKDFGDSFHVLTDDVDVFLDDLTGDFMDPRLEDVAKKAANKIKEYETIFELCKTIIYLPLYFWHYGDLIVSETHPTKLLESRRKGKWITREKLIGPKETIANRQVSVLRRDIRHGPDRTFYKAPPFKVGVSGYWKKLPVGQVGGDKRGQPIHGRTWVEKVLTWVEPTDDPGAILAKCESSQTSTATDDTFNPNKGYIYVMRSAAHDKDIFKIGLTRRPTEVRSSEISHSTGVPDKFLVVQEWEVNDCVKAESMIHQVLSQYRINPNREFFKAPYREIVKAIETVLEQLGQ